MTTAPDSMTGIVEDILLMLRGGGDLTDDEPIDERQVQFWVGTTISELLDGEVLLSRQQNRDIDPSLYLDFTLNRDDFSPEQSGAYGLVLERARLPDVLSSSGQIFIDTIQDHRGYFLQMAENRHRLSTGARSSGWGRWAGSSGISYCYEGGNLIVAYDPANLGFPKSITGRYIPAKPWEAVGLTRSLPIPQRWLRQIRLRVTNIEGRFTLATRPDVVNDGAAK